MVVDNGLPAHLTRDGAFNTNNYMEAAFRTFNVKFLELRKNKR
jgi:hypothetical protein